MIAPRALFIYHASQNEQKIKALEALGVKLIYMPNAFETSSDKIGFPALPPGSGKVDLAAMMRDLAVNQDINELHVEAGFKLNGSLLRAGCVDELLLYFAASIIGDAGQGMFNLPPLQSLNQRRMLKIHRVNQLGDDLRVIARIVD